MVVEPLGAETLLYVDVAGQEVIAPAPGRSSPEPGTNIDLGARPDTLHIFDKNTAEHRYFASRTLILHYISLSSHQHAVS